MDELDGTREKIDFGWKLRVASFATVSSWVLEEEMVAWSFKKNGIFNSTDRAEDNILWEEATIPNEESEDKGNEDKDVYNDWLMVKQWRNLFGESDDEEEFDGFWWAGFVLSNKNGSFKNHQVRKNQWKDQQ